MVTVSLRKLIVLGMNGVAVARHGLILRENDATGVRKVFRYLRDLRDTAGFIFLNLRSLFTKELKT